jgi:radical SAM-linked protein
MNAQEQITRIRVEYTKGTELRFTGHLDMQRMWERLLRRSGLPVRYSQGFHPRARLNLASALPLGFTSDSELLDFWMDEPRPLDEIHENLSAASLPGLKVKSVRSVDLREAALQEQMTASEFIVSFLDPQDEAILKDKVAALLSQEAIIRARRRKTYDLRPRILELEAVAGNEGEFFVWMRLLAEPGSTGRPDEVMGALGFNNTDTLIQRTRLLLKSHGQSGNTN